MTHHEHPNVTLVREGFEAFQKGDTNWMDQHLSDDVVWHVGGNSKWSGSYEGKAKVLDFFARQAKAMEEPPSVDIHDVLGNDDHVITIGTASATGPGGSGAEWKYVQVFRIKDGKATEVWGIQLRSFPPGRDLLCEGSIGAIRGRLQALVFGSFLSVIVSLILLGIGYRRSEESVMKWRSLPLIMGVATFPIVMIGGAVLEAINARLFEVPILVLGAGWMVLGWALVSHSLGALHAKT